MVHAVLVLGSTIVAAGAQTCLLRAAAADQAMEARCAGAQKWKARASKRIQQ